MNDRLLRVSTIAALLLGTVSLNACGGEEGHHDEEMCTNYGECFEHAIDEGKLAPGAFEECDMSCEGITHSDLTTCMEYYGMFAQIPADAIQDHCMALYPSM